MAEQLEIFDAGEVGPRLQRTNGYAATPGTGPDGETCKSCKHYRRLYNRESVFGQGLHCYRKCALIKVRWRWSKRTEIRANAPACKRWRPRRKAKGVGRA